jgi:hypothetical protein
LSSAILYLAIVAIWAVVLVPRWLRPRPPRPVPVPAEAANVEPAVPAQDDAPAWTAPAGSPDTESEYAAGEVVPSEDESEPEGEPEAAPSPGRGVSRRAEVVKARRRLLTTLMTLTVIAVALAVTRIDAYWIIIPPTALLAGYLPLLRKFARFDAERARRAARIRRAAGARAGQEQPASAEPAPPARPADSGPGIDPVPDAPKSPGGAEIIDISGRIGDQVYDQYSDAANRAVGD